MLQPLYLCTFLSILHCNIQKIAGFPLKSSLVQPVSAATNQHPRRTFSEGFSQAFEDTSDVLEALSVRPVDKMPSLSSSILPFDSKAAVAQPSNVAASGTSKKMQIDADAVMSDIAEETKNISTSIMDSISKIVSSIFGDSGSDSNQASVSPSTNTTSDPRLTAANYTKDIIPQSSPSAPSASDSNVNSTLSPTKVNVVQDSTVSSAASIGAAYNDTSGYAIVPITANGVQGIAILPVGNGSISSVLSSLTSSGVMPGTSTAAVPATNLAATAVLPSSGTQPISLPAIEDQAFKNDKNITDSTQPVNLNNVPELPAQVPVPNTTTTIPAATPTTSANNFSNGSKNTINKTPTGTGSLAAGKAEQIQDTATNPDGVRIDGALSAAGASIVINMGSSGSSTTPSAGSIRIVS